jgi:2Fe-2S ferredoxin
MGDEEDAMLAEAFHVKDNRLGCQLHIMDEMEGLEVEIAPYP